MKPWQGAPHYGKLFLAALLFGAAWGFTCGVRYGDVAVIHGFKLGAAEVESLKVADRSGRVFDARKPEAWPQRDSLRAVARPH